MNTYSLVEQTKNLLSSDLLKLKIINIYDFDIQDCMGCQNCFNEKQCGIKDDMKFLIEIMRKASGIIFAAPVYMGSIPGRMKTFIDRIAYWLHRPELIGIPCLSIVSTGGSFQKYTAKYLESIAIYWGMIPAGHILRQKK